MFWANVGTFMIEAFFNGNNKSGAAIVAASSLLDMLGASSYSSVVSGRAQTDAFGRTTVGMVVKVLQPAIFNFAFGAFESMLGGSWLRYAPIIDLGMSLELYDGYTHFEYYRGTLNNDADDFQYSNNDAITLSEHTGGMTVHETAFQSFINLIPGFYLLYLHVKCATNVNRTTYSYPTLVDGSNMSSTLYDFAPDTGSSSVAACSSFYKLDVSAYNNICTVGFPKCPNVDTNLIRMIVVRVLL